MYVKQQWLEHSSVVQPQGWMNNCSSSRYLRTSSKTSYHQTSPRDEQKSKAFPLSTLVSCSQLKNQAVLGYTTQARIIDCRCLSPDLVDTLAEKDRDWISLLTSNWQLEINNNSVLGIKISRRALHQSPLSTAALVQLTKASNYYPAVLSNAKYWLYTCILALDNVGKTRFVICSKDSTQPVRYAVFLTNRLDWSPCNIISQCLELYNLDELIANGSRAIK